MKRTVDFNQILCSPLTRRPILDIRQDMPEDEEPKPLTLGIVAMTALTGGFQGDKRDAAQKGKDYKLSLKIVAEPDEDEDAVVFSTLELNDKQTRHLSELIDKIYPAPAISAQADLLLNGDDGGDEKEEE